MSGKTKQDSLPKPLAAELASTLVPPLLRSLHTPLIQAIAAMQPSFPPSKCIANIMNHYYYHAAIAHQGKTLIYYPHTDASSFIEGATTDSFWGSSCL